jgi:spore coat protein U-like protein
VRVTKQGYASEERTATVGQGKTTVLRVRLISPGSLEISGAPPDAKVEITGPESFTAKEGLPVLIDDASPGPYSIKVSRSGYVPLEKSVRVNAGTRTRIQVALDRMGAEKAAKPEVVYVGSSAATVASPSTGARASYTFCAREDQNCSFSGTKDVAYGANGRFRYKYGVTGGIGCNNNVFGDPAYNVVKACYIVDAGTQGADIHEVAPETPPGYSFCAREDQRCSFSGTRDVAYGANGKFKYKYGVTGGIDCHNNVFGDPIYNVKKSCFIK